MHTFGNPWSQKGDSWEVWGPFLARVVAQDSILTLKMEPMGPPRLPKWDQNGSKIHPKFDSKSIRFLVMFLDHFGRCFGSPNGDNFGTLSIFLKKS